MDQALADEFGIPYLECSAKEDSESVNEVFLTAARMVAERQAYAVYRLNFLPTAFVALLSFLWLF